jgi:hypothetical protein
LANKALKTVKKVKAKVNTKAGKQAKKLANKALKTVKKVKAKVTAKAGKVLGAFGQKALEWVVRKLPPAFRPVAQKVVEMLVKHKGNLGKIIGLYRAGAPEAKKNIRDLVRLVTPLRNLLLLKNKRGINPCAWECGVCKKLLHPMLNTHYITRASREFSCGEMQIRYYLSLPVETQKKVSRWWWGRKSHEAAKCVTKGKVDWRTLPLSQDLTYVTPDKTWSQEANITHWLGKTTAIFPNPLRQQVSAVLPKLSASDLQHDDGYFPAWAHLRPIVVTRSVRGKDNKATKDISCIAHMNHALLVCSTCCCKRGLIQAHVATSLVYTKPGVAKGSSCAAWFYAMDTIFRLSVNFLRMWAGIVPVGDCGAM